MIQLLGSAIFMQSYTVANYIGYYTWECLSLVHYTYHFVYNTVSEPTRKELSEYETMLSW